MEAFGTRFKKIKQTPQAEKAEETKKGCPRGWPFCIQKNNLHPYSQSESSCCPATFVRLLSPSSSSEHQEFHMVVEIVLLHEVFERKVHTIAPVVTWV